jgi:hypothetical protein
VPDNSISRSAGAPRLPRGRCSLKLNNGIRGSGDSPAAPSAGPPEREVDQRYLNGYSFGPGCFIYLLNRVFWPIFLIGLLLRLLFRILACTLTPDQFGTLYILAGVLGLAYAAVLLWIGRFARRLRWKRLRWRSFDQFRSEEYGWNIGGIFGWVVGFLWSLLWR